MNDQSSGPGRSDPTTWVGVDPSKDYTRPPPLSRPRIVRAALRLVDEKGLTALTMRALATELEVSPMALYNHVQDKDELVDLMVDLMLGEVDTTSREGDWLTQLRALVCSYHQALADHHQLARVYSRRVRIGPHGLLIMERAIGLLLEGGFSPSEASDAFFALFTYTAGYHQVGQIAPLRDNTTRDKTGYYPPLPPEQIPAINTVSSHLDGVHRPGRFDYGLDLLLAGLRTKVTRAAETAAAPQ
ncbi:MAG TPA: TetR/AcrR family transcriptional regulator [Pseudonocardiaceae bacterium]|nr:TetR/AcrR family transcriptional regulator [Pseudonocardiaceae bacterium]